MFFQEVYELSHDGEKFIAEEVVRHETGLNAVMNCSSYSDDKRSYLVAGQESFCQLYNVQSVLVNETIENIETIGDNEIKQRKKTDNHIDKNKNKNLKKLKFAIKPGDSVKTDFDSDEPLLRVIRISRFGNLMATGEKTFINY